MALVLNGTDKIQKRNKAKVGAYSAHETTYNTIQILKHLYESKILRLILRNGK